MPRRTVQTSTVSANVLPCYLEIIPPFLTAPRTRSAVYPPAHSDDVVSRVGDVTQWLTNDQQDPHNLF